MLKYSKTILRAIVLGLLGFAAVSPAAQAWTTVPNQQVADGGETGYSYSTQLSVYVTTAGVHGYTYVSNPNGHGVYISGYYTNYKQALNAETGRNTTVYLSYASGSRAFGAPTAGPWYASAKLCIDVPIWFDPCSSSTGLVTNP